MLAAHLSVGVQEIPLYVAESLNALACRHNLLSNVVEFKKQPRRKLIIDTQVFVTSDLLHQACISIRVKSISTSPLIGCRPSRATISLENLLELPLTTSPLAVQLHGPQTGARYNNRLIRTRLFWQSETVTNMGYRSPELHISAVSTLGPEEILLTKSETLPYDSFLLASMPPTRRLSPICWSSRMPRRERTASPERIFTSF